MQRRHGAPGFLLALLLLPIFASCTPSSSLSSAALPDVSEKQAELRVAALANLDDRGFLEKAYALVLLRAPETAFALGISSAYGIPEDELDDLSDAHAWGSRALFLAIKAEADRRGKAGADKDNNNGDSLGLAAFSVWLGDKARDIELSIDKYPLSPYVNSPDQLALDYFTEFRQIRNPADAERYIACLSKLPAKMDGLVAALDRRAKAGVILPRGIYEYTLQGLRAIANASPRSNPFYDAFARKLGAAALADAGMREALLSKAEAACAAYALPAWRSLVDALVRQAGSVPAEGGAWRLPQGREYYAACLARQTTTRMDAAQIHDVGKRELARIQTEMRERFASLGYPREAGLASLFARLGKEGGSLVGENLLARIGSQIKDMDAHLGELVIARPRIPVEAVFGEIGGYYQPPSVDGSRPGRYFVAAGDRRFAFDVPTTVWHETIPGHHLQIARALESDLPGFLRGADFLAYTEGWALYAERLAFEIGVYKDDSAGDLGRLRMEALRAARLVADTGINSMGWSFGQTLSYLQENTGLDTGMLQAEVTRYIIDPGQATSYYVGFLEILRLRDKSKAALGPRFDLRRFNETVLANGALPLELLDRVIEKFIATSA